MSQRDDELAKLLRLITENEAAIRQEGRIIAERDRLAAELNDAIEALRRRGVSDEEIKRILDAADAKSDPTPDCE